MAITNKLSAIGDAIREKTSTTALLSLDEMPEAIRSIETSGGDFVINSSDVFYAGSIIESLLDSFDTVSFPSVKYAQTPLQGLDGTEKDLTKVSMTFVPRTDPMIGTSNASASGLVTRTKFTNTSYPTLTGTISVPNSYGMFSSYLGTEFPMAMLDNLTFDYTGTGYSYFTPNNPIGFDYMREIPKELIALYNQNPEEVQSWELGNFYAPYGNLIGGFLVEKAEDFIIPFKDSNIPYRNEDSWPEYAGIFDSSYCTEANLEYIYVNPDFSNLPRISKFTFETNADGTPKVANWYCQHFCVAGAGFGFKNPYSYGTDPSTEYADKEVTDAESYARLKDDPDWWTTQPAYSRFNKVSVQQLIESLPDCSSAVNAHSEYPNRLILGQGIGSGTDGGAQSDIEQTYIDLANSKGWQVYITSNFSQ